MKTLLSENGLGEKLKNLRLSANLTQEQFAEIIGVSRTAVAKWENGYAEPTLQNIVRISEIFDVGTDYLLGVKRKREPDVFNMSDSAICALNKFIDEIKNSP